MKIINNISFNHFNELNQLLTCADEIYIISPYLMETFDDVFSEMFSNSGVKNIFLITTLKDNDLDLIKKADALYSFIYRLQRQ